MKMNELFMCPPASASASASDYDELLPPPLSLPLIPPLLHIDSSSSSSSSCFPFLNFTPHFHLHLDSVLGSLSSLSSLPWNPPPGQKAIPLPRNCGSPDCRDESSRDGSSISEQVPGKRRCLERGKLKVPSKFAVRGDDSVVTTTKRSREDEEVDERDGIGPAKLPKLGNGAEEEEDEGRKKKGKKEKKGGGGDDGVEPPKDYIHVRARRGQATDSHSLAERVRREKISERMKMLQDLVPSCSKVTGKALMLDEIINYVQSLQRQVEFLSMKLASVDTNKNYGMNTRFLSKDMFQSTNTISTTAAAQLSMFEPPLCEKMPEVTNFKCSADPPLSDSRIPPLNGLDDGILAPFRGEDLHSIVEMGLFGQTNLLDFDGQGQMNNNSMDLMMGELQQ